MMFIPPPPSSRQVGRKLGKLLATMRKLQTAAKPPTATPKHNMSTTTQRPTPEVNAHRDEMNHYEFDEELALTYALAKRLECERDEAFSLLAAEKSTPATAALPTSKRKD